jgi:adenylate cyclase
MNSLPEIEQDLLINVYHAGLKHYKQREWYKAIKEFKRILRYFPSDGPSRVYVARCLDSMENSPPADWDGVYEFETK